MRKQSYPVRFGLASVVVLSALVTGCLGGIGTDGHGLRTFSWNANQAVCNADQPIPVVVGALHTDPAQSESVWLVDRTGHHLSVVWPAGFAIRFDPSPAVLFNERGDVVATEGSWVTLGHTRPSDAAGTFDDPYFASEMTLGGCYPR